MLWWDRGCIIKAFFFGSDNNHDDVSLTVMISPLFLIRFITISLGSKRGLISSHNPGGQSNGQLRQYRYLRFTNLNYTLNPLNRILKQISAFSIDALISSMVVSGSVFVAGAVPGMVPSGSSSSSGTLLLTDTYADMMMQLLTQWVSSSVDWKLPFLFLYQLK